MNKLSGYTEIPLPDGSFLPLKFGMWTMRELCKKWNTSLAGISEEYSKRMQDDPLTALFDIISPAVEYGTSISGTRRTLSEMEISCLIDDTGGFSASPVPKQVMDAFNNSFGEDVAEPAVEAGKSSAPNAG